MSIFGIVQGFNTVKSDVSDLFSFGSKGKFSLTNDIIKDFVTEVNDELWAENPGYAFVVSSSDDPLQPWDNSDFAEFKFQINPSSIRQEEDYSIMPRATQTGAVIEHEGSVFKRLTISGTTGIQPKRGIGSVTDTGQVQLGAGHSGYHEFNTLINYIRAYAQFKTDPTNEKARLVFKNFKDNEYWFVEPLRFSKNRDSTKPHLYYYEIQLLITGKAKRKKSKIEGFFDSIKNGIDTYILEPLADIQSIIEDGTNFILQVENEAETIILEPLRQITSTMNGISKGASVVSNLPREFYQSYKKRVTEVGNSVSDLFGQNNSGYDTFFDRKAVVTRPAPPILTGKQVDLMQAFLDLEGIIDRILSTNKLFEVKTTESNATYEGYFNNAISLPKPTTTTEIVVARGDTIERIASRYLGTSDRMLEIITLNNLEPPYIDPTGTSTSYRVKNPGSKLLIPQFTNTQFQNENNVDARPSSLTKGLSAIDKYFGIDFKLSKDFDLVFNNRGDLEYVFGLANAAQSLAIKVNLEKGSLPVYPDLGVNAGIGEKANVSISQIKQDIRATIIQDPRFSNLVNLDLKRDGSSLSMMLKIFTNVINQPIPIRIDLG